LRERYAIFCFTSPFAVLLTLVLVLVLPVLVLTTRLPDFLIRFWFNTNLYAYLLTCNTVVGCDTREWSLASLITVDRASISDCAVMTWTRCHSPKCPDTFVVSTTMRLTSSLTAITPT